MFTLSFINISIVSTKRDSARGLTFHAIHARNKIDHADGGDVDQADLAPPAPQDYVAVEISMPDESPPPETPKPNQVLHSATLLEPSLRLFKRNSRIDNINASRTRRDSVDGSGSYETTTLTNTNRISLPGSIE